MKRWCSIQSRVRGRGDSGQGALVAVAERPRQISAETPREGPFDPPTPGPSVVCHPWFATLPLQKAKPQLVESCQKRAVSLNLVEMSSCPYSGLLVL